MTVAPQTCDDRNESVAGHDSFPQVDGYAGTYTQYHRNLIATYFHSLATKVTENTCWGDPKCVSDHNLRDEWDLPLGQTAP